VRRPLLAALALLPVLTLAPVAGAANDTSAAAHEKRVCAHEEPGYAACDAHVVTDAHGTPVATTTPAGFGPAQLQGAYGIAGRVSGGRTVAIVDAYNDPKAFNDVNVYRAQYGIPPLSSTCGAGAACFRQVNQSGGTKLPRNNGGWAQEISLDLDMVSAACPDCNILLVEASSNSFANLAAAVSYAKTAPGVVAVSNSYGGSEYSGEASYRSVYAGNAGQWITASSGDSGYGAQSPASYPGVVAVGGTSLTVSSTNGYGGETAWSGAGSGCSAYETALNNTAICAGKRAVADVSAVADPNTGVAVYDSYADQGVSGWLVFGGTSASAPFIASVHALAGSTTNDAGTLYGGTASVHDVVGGSNGTCTNTPMCTAVSGYDGPTGVGSPNGTTGF